jgi:hypothetical protein
MDAVTAALNDQKRTVNSDSEAEAVHDIETHPETQTSATETAPSNTNNMQAFEVDASDSCVEETEHEGLLVNKQQQQQQQQQQHALFAWIRLDRSNLYIFAPRLYYSTGWGVIGPHWFGPVGLCATFTTVSLLIVHAAIRNVGPLTAATCVVCYATCVGHLINTSLRDPGVVSKNSWRSIRSTANTTAGANEQQNQQQWCWCDACQTLQPPRGAHCPDCNVCVDGFDHHCVWMGTCIGTNNLKPFVNFNKSWILYVLYVIVWVVILGPTVCNRHNDKGSNTGG